MNNINRDRKVINIINDSNNIIKEINNDDILINYYNDDQKDISICIDVMDDSILNINMVSIIKEKVNINILVNIKGNNNTVNVYYRCISENEESNVSVNVHVFENTINNKVLEDLKGLNEEGNVTLFPILEIDTCEVDAEHYATVGQIEKDKLFYLMQKGISKENAYKILKDLFIYSLFNNSFKELLNGSEGLNE